MVQHPTFRNHKQCKPKTPCPRFRRLNAVTRSSSEVTRIPRLGPHKVATLNEETFETQFVMGDMQPQRLSMFKLAFVHRLHRNIVHRLSAARAATCATKSWEPTFAARNLNFGLHRATQIVRVLVESGVVRPIGGQDVLNHGVGPVLIVKHFNRDRNRKLFGFGTAYVIL